MHEIKPIRLSLPYKMGAVNCYLIKTDSGYILVDTDGHSFPMEAFFKKEQK